MTVWPPAVSPGRISQHNAKETMMKLKMLVTALLASFLGLSTGLAHADDTAAKPKSARVAAPAATVAAPAAPVAISQQDKMRQCSKDATGKKGAERKDFMKTCLSKKAKT
jgi:psiF repeat